MCVYYLFGYWLKKHRARRCVLKGQTNENSTSFFVVDFRSALFPVQTHPLGSCPQGFCCGGNSVDGDIIRRPLYDITERGGNVLAGQQVTSQHQRRLRLLSFMPQRRVWVNKSMAQRWCNNLFHLLNLQGSNVYSLKSSLPGVPTYPCSLCPLSHPFLLLLSIRYLQTCLNKHWWGAICTFKDRCFW